MIPGGVRRLSPCWWLVLTGLLALSPAVLAAPPAGFVYTPIGSGWDDPVGTTFDANGRMYVWERTGRVWIVENGVKLPTPLIDIHDEVGAWTDHGMLGFALHPDFLTNGWIYLFYVVDYHHLAYAGTPSYDPLANQYDTATIGRITRYTAQSASGFTSVDPLSRAVIFGESASTGCPIVSLSHGVGTVVFAQDGSLLLGCGDGASSFSADPGGNVPASYPGAALAAGIITPAENVGSFRSQLLSSHAGKIMRIDPVTGDGLQSNPFFSAASPRSAASRTYALGFRNPFRFTIRPETGSHNIEDGDPGMLYVGDVGWNSWEEIQVVSQPGQNFGWPLFEGMDPAPDFPALAVQNQTAPNPLFGVVPGCSEPFFRFSQLIIQETLSPTPSFPNPCDAAEQIPASIPRWVHRRPDLDYFHSPSGPARVRTFSGENPTTADVGAPGSPVSGAQFGGYASTGGAWYTGTAFPPLYRDVYLQADLSIWIRAFRFDGNEQPTEVLPFDHGTMGVVHLTQHPTDGSMYGVSFAGSGSVFRISYNPGNQPPIARITADATYGAAPLSVQLDGTTSSDPEGVPLTYTWNFGDGSPTSTSPQPLHVFSTLDTDPTPYTVQLTVRDSVNQTATASLVVSLNNSPPAVAITNPIDSGLYTMTGNTNLALTADISDVEHAPGELVCAWETRLHHNTHSHPHSTANTCTASVVVTPVGCDANTYAYEVELTVSDPAGLSTMRTAWIHPDCGSLAPIVCGDLDENAALEAADADRLRAAFADPDGAGLDADELEHCSVAGAGECDLVDWVVLQRRLEERAPGVLPVCPAASP